MPPPKRPFTTSSLTSTLKSALASQPLLSSQASSLAQKTPFFNAINQQFQQHQHQHQQQQQQQQQQRQAHDGAQQSSVFHEAPSVAGFTSGSRGNTNASKEMTRDAQHSAPVPSGSRPNVDTAPAVDLSHLTEEERLMIQSVMAKAEMADMGLPVDTSMPSSTNLPSSTSQALTQQREQQQQHQRQIQQQQQQHQQQQQQQQQQQPNIPTDSSQGLQQLHMTDLQHQTGANNNLVQQNQQQQNNQLNQHTSQKQAQSIMEQNFDGQQGMLIDNGLTYYQTQLSGPQTQQPHQLDRSQLNNSTTLMNQQKPGALEQERQQYLTQPVQQSQFNSNSMTNDVQPQSPRIDPRQLSNQQQQQIIGSGREMMAQQTSLPMQQQQQLDRAQLQFDNMGSMSNQMININLQQAQLATPSSLMNADQMLQSAPLMEGQNLVFNTVGQSGDQTVSEFYQPMGTIESYNGADNQSNVPSQQQQLFNQVRVCNPVVDRQAPDCQIQQSTRMNYVSGVNQMGEFQPSPVQVYPVDWISQQPAARQRTPVNRSRAQDVLNYNSDQNMTSEVDYEQSPSDQDVRRGGSSRSRRRKMEQRSMDFEETVRSRNTRETTQRAAQQPNDHKARQLPQPGCSGQSRKSPSGKFHGACEPTAELSRRSKSVVRQQERGRDEQVPGELSGRQKRTSSEYPTDTDSDKDTPSTADSSERRLPTRDSAGKPKAVSQLAGPESNNSNGQLERSEKALQLLSELKLSEQANQVMEQQQLLIKQSQELIKLQQAQLEQQALSKKTANDQEVKQNDPDKNMTNSDFPNEPKDESPKSKSNYASQQLSREDLPAIKSDLRDHSAKLEADLTSDTREVGAKSSSKTSRQARELLESDSEPAAGRRRTRSKSAHPNDSELDAESNAELSAKSQRLIESRQRKLVGTPPNSLGSHSSSKRDNRDLFQSPTDSTDSDGEIPSQSGLKRRQRKTPTKPRGAARRREPTGLPPSPLPVAAAIQLHHMQQQHLRQHQLTNNMLQSKCLRSRSVTSSPNHMLERFNSGYLTDNQRTKPSSPDTMSEFGGMRRRKLLPEPPTNVVPLTPSIVRRLIQAQKANTATSNRFQPLQTQTNRPPMAAGSYTDRYSTPTERLINARIRSSLDALNMRYPASGLTTDRWNSGESASKVAPRYPHLMADDRRITAESSPGVVSGHGQQLPSCFNDPILMSSSIKDVKETPELDKLISNLDEYYGLDGKKGKKNPTVTTIFDSSGLASQPPRIDSGLLSSPGRKALSNHSEQFSSNRSYADRYPYQSRSLVDYNQFARRNSEGHSYSYQTRYLPPPSAYDNLSYETETRSSTNFHPSTRDPMNNNSRIPIHMMQSENRSLSQRTDPSLNTTAPTVDDYSWYTSYNSRTPMGLGKQRNVESRPYHRIDTRDELNVAGGYQNSYPTTAYPTRTVAANYKNVSDGRQDHPGPSMHNRNDTAHTNLASMQLGYSDRYCENMTPLTKDDIINNGPKFNSIGYRFRTENQNKYVTELRTPIECLRSRYPYPYRRILLSKNPKDRIGNGIGVKIVGGQHMPNLYDQVNKCMVTSGAFVAEVSQSSRVHFLNEMHEGDQIIEWNGVNLCNRSDEEIQQILLSQFSDDEVEIIYLNRDKFAEAYGSHVKCDQDFDQNYMHEQALASNSWEMFAGLDKQSGDYFSPGGPRYANGSTKRGIRRKLSLSSISHMWSR